MATEANKAARFCATAAEGGGDVVIGVHPGDVVVAGANVGALPLASIDTDACAYAQGGTVVDVGTGSCGSDTMGEPEC